jgi:threonine dehydratase
MTDVQNFDEAPSSDHIRAAAVRLAGHVIETPLLESPAFNALMGGRVLVKAEALQRTGSFKFRGAFNRLSMIDPEARAGGVVAYSSGNHAQGVAAAAAMLGMPATIVMPNDAPAIKIANTRSYGAEVVLYDRVHDDREAIGLDIARSRNATLVKPYDDSGVIAGQGTVGLEILRQAEARGARLDAVLVCCSGGGLVSGTAIAIKEASPETEIYLVEPEDFDDAGRSLKGGARVGNAKPKGSICDALMAAMPGEITFPIMQRLLAGGIAISDDDAMAAMVAAFTHFKLVVEPGGAAALAAVVSGKFPIKGKTVAVVCSGGNVDPQFYADVLRAA